MSKKDQDQQSNEVAREVTFKVSGTICKIHEPYEAGHTLSAIEASVLNQTFRENVRNGIAKKVAEDVENAQTIVSEFASTYAFGARRSNVSVDPVSVEARKIATIAVNAALAAASIKKADYPS